MRNALQHSATIHHPSKTTTTLLTVLAATACLSLAAANANAGATWSSPIKLATVTQSSSILAPAVAVNASGKKLAVWVQDGQVQARAFENGVWGNVSTLSLASLGVSEPSVALSEDGQAVVSWLQQGSGQSTVESVFFSNGQWSLPTTVSSTGVTVSSPKVDVSGNGQATLAWAESDSSAGSCGIQTATANTGSAWSAPLTLANTCHTQVSLSVNAQGEALVGWGDLSFLTGKGVYAATRDASGIWTDATELTPPAYRQYLPAFSLGEDGTAVAVWNNAYNGLMFSRKRRGEDWTPASTAYSGNSSITTFSDVAVDGQGNATAVFMIWNMLPTGAIAYPLQSVRLMNTANTWSKPLYVTSKGQNIYRFSVDASPAGSVAVAWSDSVTSRSGVASMLPGEARWSNAGLNNGGNDVALDMAAGNATVLWTGITATQSLRASTAVTP